MVKMRIFAVGKGHNRGFPYAGGLVFETIHGMQSMATAMGSRCKKAISHWKEG